MIETNIAFSQVREDPELDLFVLNNIKSKRKKILMIGSGGCSILTMLLSENLKSIDLVDSNSSQIELVKLKIALLKNLSSKEFINFIEGNDKELILSIINEIKEDSFFNENHWSKKLNKDALLYGINQIGVFEQLFKELRQSFSVCPMQSYNKKEWDLAFKTVFNRQNLINSFGEEAVKYSMSKEFVEHFSSVMFNAINKYENKNNYFLDQIFKGKYNKDRPIYLNEKNKKIILSNIHKINFIHKPFHEYIKETKKEYDFIHTSNITDWLPLDILSELFFDINKKLSTVGLVLSRRLNGDHSLEQIMSEHFITEKTVNNNFIENDLTRFSNVDKINLKDNDKSFFYNEVIVGRKNET